MIKSIIKKLMVEKIKGTKRLDHLRDIEKKIQEDWEINKIYTSKNQIDWENSLSFEEKNKQKYMVTFPYPYMNGRLHLGHAFSFSKCEFQARFQRLTGKNVLLPFAYHCTGMPIAAAANKIKKELENGVYETIRTREKNKVIVNPAKNETITTIEENKVLKELKEKKEKKDETKVVKQDVKKEEKKDVKKDVKKEEKKQEDKKQEKKQDNNNDKTKKKEVSTEPKKVVYQTDILLSCEVDIDLIPKFADPYFWLEYFPPLGEKDLKAFGAGIDYTRSFITTEVYL